MSYHRPSRRFNHILRLGKSSRLFGLIAALIVGLVAPMALVEEPQVAHADGTLALTVTAEPGVVLVSWEGDADSTFDVRAEVAGLTIVEHDGFTETEVPIASAPGYPVTVSVRETGGPWSEVTGTPGSIDLGAFDDAALFSGIIGLSRQWGFECPDAKQLVAPGSVMSFTNGSRLQSLLPSTGELNQGSIVTCADPATGDVTIHRADTCVGDVTVTQHPATGVAALGARHSDGIASWLIDRTPVGYGFRMASGSYREIDFEASGHITIDADCNPIYNVFWVGLDAIASAGELLGDAASVVASASSAFVKCGEAISLRDSSTNGMGSCFTEAVVGYHDVFNELAKATSENKSDRLPMAKVGAVLVLLQLGANASAATFDGAEDFFHNEPTRLHFTSTRDVLQLNGAFGQILTTHHGDESFYLDTNGWLHPIPTTEVYTCHGGDENRRFVDDALPHGMSSWTGEPAECRTLVPGDIAVHADGDAHQIVEHNGGIARRHVPGENTFECLVAQGHTPVQGVARYRIDELENLGDAYALCVPDVEREIITDSRQIVSWANDTSLEAVGALLPMPTSPTLGDSARAGIVVDGIYRPITDERVWHCLTSWQGVEFHGLLASDQVQSFDVGPPATCSTGLADGTIIERSDGWSGVLYTAADGVEFVAPIETAETHRCLSGLGAPVRLVTGRQFAAFLVGQTPQDECVDIDAFRGTIIRHVDGTSTFHVDPATGELRPITTGGTFWCLSLWAGSVEHGERFTDAQLAKFSPGSTATCTDHIDTTKGKIVTAGDHSIYVTPSGLARNITSRNAYFCLVEAGVATVSVTSHEWQQAFEYTTDQPGCTKILDDGTRSVLERPDGSVQRIADTQSWYCHADRLPSYRIVNVSSATIDALTVIGDAPRCLSASRYEGTVIRDSNGRAGIVLNGQWRSIPDGHSWRCYRMKGYEIGEYSISPTHLDSLAKGPRLRYCLHKPDYAGNKLVERSGGHWYVTSSSGCSHHIRNGWTYEYWRYDRARPVAATRLNSEHIQSLGTCSPAAYRFSKRSFKSSIIRRKSTGAIFFVNSKGCRYHITWWATYEARRSQGYRVKHWTAADSEIASLPYCGKHYNFITPSVVEGHVVRGPDGTSWLVINGEWKWIRNGSYWNHLVNKCGLAPNTYSYSWSVIDKVKEGGGWSRDRGRWASWWDYRYC